MVTVTNLNGQNSKWLLVAIWTERHEGARARRAAATLPPTAFGAAVRALAAETPLAAMGHVGRWLGGRHPWAHLAAALVHGQQGDDEASDRDQRHCVLLWMSGGPSQIDTFDMKPEGPAEYRGEFSPISTNTPGTQICEHLPLLAQRSHLWSLVRSLTHRENGHDKKIRRIAQRIEHPRHKTAERHRHRREDIAGCNQDY